MPLAVPPPAPTPRVPLSPKCITYALNPKVFMEGALPRDTGVGSGRTCVQILVAWPYGNTAMRQYFSTAVLQYGNTVIRQYGNMAVRKHGSMAVCQYGSAAVRVG